MTAVDDIKRLREELAASKRALSAALEQAVATIAAQNAVIDRLTKDAEMAKAERTKAEAVLVAIRALLLHPVGAV